MKKISLILAAFALVLGISQCRKQESPAQSGEKQHIVLTASNGNDGSKVAVDALNELLKLTWEPDDVINVSGGAEGTLHYISAASPSKATFEGYVTKLSDDPIVFSVGTPNYLLEQDGTTDGENGLKSRIYLKSGPEVFQLSGNYDGVTMTLQYAVLKLDVSKLGTSGLLTIKIGEETVASVTDVSSSEGKAVFVAVPANGESTAYTISCGGKKATEPWTLVANTFYTKKNESGPLTGEAIVLEPDGPEGALPGVFTVSSSGTKVHFSKGNLYYDGSFKFQPQQYNIQTSFSSSVWGYFGWSTNTNYGKSTSEDNDDYSGSFYDWGKAFDNAGTWRTLSKNEWGYLFQNHRYKFMTLGGVSGVVVAPDGFIGDIPDYNTSTWTAAEDSGLVFLPEGYRVGNEIYKTTYLLYWSSTPDGSESAYRFISYNGNIITNGSYDRYQGQSVRLVTNVAN